MSAVTGKQIRLNRLIEQETGACLIVAIDHGMTSPAFLSEVYDTGLRVKEAIAGGANVLMLGRGMAKQHAGLFKRSTSLALMLTASAAGKSSGAEITPIGSVDEALRTGADARSFGEIVAACARPVVLAGGSRLSDEELLTRMALARDAGAVGCSVGRNVFQHQNPQAMTEALSRIFRDKWTARQAAEELHAKLVPVTG